MQTTYFNGDLAQYTGKTQTLHGGLFYEYVMLEGHLKGQTKVTQRAPVEFAGMVDEGGEQFAAYRGVSL